MKDLAKFLFPTMKAVFQVTIFFVSIGWASYGAILLIVKAEGKEVEAKMKQIREIDMQHLDKRFDRIEKLIKEN